LTGIPARGTTVAMHVDSDSTGDAARHVRLADIEARFAALPPAPADAGRVHLIVARVESGRRKTPDSVTLTPESGIPGDAWGRRPPLMPEAQITVMQIDVAELIANGQPLELFGDNLFLALDLSVGNLPIGSRVRIGGATFEITPKPHNGCKKFRARFGDDALAFVSRPDIRHRNLRGIYMRVTAGGVVARGDRVDVLHRASGGTS
jgi:MOSC domain-containing protein YiiM